MTSFLRFVGQSKPMTKPMQKKSCHCFPDTSLLKEAHGMTAEDDWGLHPHLENIGSSLKLNGLHCCIKFSIDYTVSTTKLKSFMTAHSLPSQRLLKHGNQPQPCCCPSLIREDLSRGQTSLWHSGPQHSFQQQERLLWCWMLPSGLHCSPQETPKHS